MISRVEKFIRQYHMIPAGGKVVAGFSGGADSLCLMEILRELAPELHFSLLAIHIHHGIREKSADDDADFVREYCRKYRIPLRVEWVSAVLEAKEKKIGLEEAGRLLRYRKFEEYRAECGADVIAAAHHQNDQAETVLFQMARGSSITGLGGMRPVQQRVIRPLLCVSKEEIQQFLIKRGLTWREDETNHDNTYTRNCIRNQIMPVLEEKVNKKAVSHIARLSLEMQEIDAYLRGQEEAAITQYCRQEANQVLIKTDLCRENPLIVRRVIYRVITTLLGRRKDITGEHVDAVKQLFSKQSGRQVVLPGGLLAARSYDGILAGIPESGKAEEKLLQLTVPMDVSFAGMRITLAEKKVNPGKIEEKKYTKWFDYDKIKNSLVLRKRHSEDVLCIDEQGHHKKLNRFLMDQKVPKEQRDTVWILADGSHVVWVLGSRIGAEYKISESTVRVVEVQIEGENGI